MNDEAFRDAMARFASGVTIVTTVAPDGSPRGYTASAFTSLSVDPPMVLSCLAEEAECHEVFVAAETFAVSILGPQHEDLAMRFATRGADKFGGGEFSDGSLGLPVLSNAIATVECRLEGLFPGGDHTILTGLVEHCTVGGGPALVYFMREFFEISEPKPAPAL